MTKPLYSPDRDARVNRSVRGTQVGINISIAVYGGYAAHAGLGIAGVGTVLLWVFAGGAAASAAVWMLTPRLLAAAPAVGFAVIADVGQAAALSVLDDPRIRFAGCMLFALTGIFVALHVPQLGLMVHLVIVAGFTSAAAALMIIDGRTTTAIAVVGASLWLWILVGAPLAIRRIWISTSEAAELARHDPLTGVLNRTGLEHAYRRMAAHAHRDGASMWVIVADIDNFKSVNDRYGHNIGDTVIVATAQQLINHYGARAAVARTGGEEFTVIATGDTTQLLELITTTPTTTPIASGPLTTISLGATECEYRSLHDPLHASTTRADHSMYTAKRSGGNTLHIAPSHHTG